MKYKLQDLIDMEHFQNLQDRLNEIYSFPSSIIDNEGNILTATAWQDICTQFHRKNKDCEKLCIQSDLYIKKHIHEANPAVTYHCPHGLVDNATPIIIDGFHYGNFFTGQFFLEEPDMEFFRAQSKKYRFAEDAYLEAVKRVPIWTQQQLNSYLFFIKGLIAIISESGLKKLKEVENRKLIESSEKRHRSILKSAMDGYWLTDTEGRLLEVNDSYCRMSGYTENELLTMRISDLEVIEKPQLVAEHMQKVISQGSDRFESKHRGKDGTVFNVEVSVQYRTEEGGECVCFIRDITELKQAEDTLRENEKQYRTLFETMVQGVVQQSADGKIITANSSAEKILGLSIDQMRGITSVDPRWKSIHEDGTDYSGETHPAMIALKTGQMVKDAIMGVFNHQTDSYRWISINSIPQFKVGEDKPYQVFTTFDDITKRKQAQASLRDSEQFLNEIGSIAQIGGWEHDLATGEGIWTRETYNIVEIESGPVPGSDEHLSYYTPKDRVILEEAYRLSIETGEQFDLKLQAATAKGRSIWVRVVGRPEYKDGICVKMKGILQNITEQKNVEMQLQQAQKMESIGRLAGGVAHDYNNISSIIIGYSELALEQVKPEDPLHEDLVEILTAAKRSTDITRQLLAFARKQTIAPKILDLNNTIGSLLKMLRRLIGENIDLAWLPGEELWSVKIDPSQVDQIVANIGVNARDAIADVGKVTIETQNISFDVKYCADHAGFIPGDYLLLAVSDDGSGIEPDIMDNIFEPFFTTKEQGKGTGLGLSTVYGIVKQNNGFINVYSEPKKGTTIKIYLPRHEGQAVEAYSDNNIEIPLSRGETVLLVEDDVSILKLGKRILEELGYIVISSSSSIEAAELAKEKASELNLLITDVIMPEMNGQELSEHLKSLWPNLKILFMSGYTANVIAHRGVLDDGVNFISKPFSKRDMAVKVREVLDAAISNTKG